MECRFSPSVIKLVEMNTIRRCFSKHITLIIVLYELMENILIHLRSISSKLHKCNQIRIGYFMALVDQIAPLTRHLIFYNFFKVV
jgi:hypothetical protein